MTVGEGGRREGRRKEREGRAKRRRNHPASWGVVFLLGLKRNGDGATGVKGGGSDHRITDFHSQQKWRRETSHNLKLNSKGRRTCHPRNQHFFRTLRGIRGKKIIVAKFAREKGTPDPTFRTLRSPPKVELRGGGVLLVRERGSREGWVMGVVGSLREPGDGRVPVFVDGNKKQVRVI